MSCCRQVWRLLKICGFKSRAPIGSWLCVLSPPEAHIWPWTSLRLGYRQKGNWLESKLPVTQRLASVHLWVSPGVLQIKALLLAKTTPKASRLLDVRGSKKVSPAWSHLFQRNYIQRYTNAVRPPASLEKGQHLLATPLSLNPRGLCVSFHNKPDIGEAVFVPGRLLEWFRFTEGRVSHMPPPCMESLGHWQHPHQSGWSNSTVPL